MFITPTPAFKALHHDVLQLFNESNFWDWPIASGDTVAFIAYFRFDDRDSARNYGKYLLTNGLAESFQLRSARRFMAAGFEIKVYGLSQKTLNELVEEFEARDWVNSVFFDGPRLEALYRALCDRDSLQADDYDSTWDR
jgi:hypothetical protein